VTGAGVAARTRREAASPEAPVRIETVSSESEFARLGDSWDELVRGMPRPSPFLLHAWLIEWWRHYGRGGDDLAVHVAYRGTRLVAALPLCIRRRFGLRVGEFVGGSWAALADVLVAPGEDASAADLVGHAASSKHDLASLFGLPGSSRLVAALPPNALRLVERLEAPVLDVSAGWDAVYNSRTTSKSRSERRRRMRQLGGLGVVESSVARTREELGPALEDAFRVHSLRWQERRDPTGFITPTGMRFHRAALLRLAETDVTRLLTIRLDGRPIAFALYLQLSGRAYGLTMGFDPVYARFGLGSEAKLQSLEASAGEGITRVELLGADAAHKRRFTDRFEPIYQGIGLARTLRGRVAAEALIDGIRLRRAIKRSSTVQKLYYRIPLKRG
jgi:CelD/BcsL family acetyltransferase involved in cellulose biosynthesis